MIVAVSTPTLVKSALFAIYIDLFSKQVRVKWHACLIVSKGWHAISYTSTLSYALGIEGYAGIYRQYEGQTRC
jgi:hypothetical protein